MSAAMSTQDPITEMLNAMEQNPDLADVFRTRILGDDFKGITELLLNQIRGETHIVRR